MHSTWTGDDVDAGTSGYSVGPLGMILWVRPLERNPLTESQWFCKDTLPVSMWVLGHPGILQARLPPPEAQLQEVLDCGLWALRTMSRNGPLLITLSSRRYSIIGGENLTKQWTKLHAYRIRSKFNYLLLV